jgi:hypothetical protein
VAPLGRRNARRSCSPSRPRGFGPPYHGLTSSRSRAACRTPQPLPARLPRPVPLQAPVRLHVIRPRPLRQPGPTVTGSRGQTRPHPLLDTERALQRDIAVGLKRLSPLIVARTCSRSRSFVMPRGGPSRRCGRTWYYRGATVAARRRLATLPEHEKAPVWRGLSMRWRGLEPPRPIQVTRPSTLRVYQFRHQRAGGRRPRRSLADSPGACSGSPVDGWRAKITSGKSQYRDILASGQGACLDRVIRRSATQQITGRPLSKQPPDPRTPHDAGSQPPPAPGSPEPGCAVASGFPDRSLGPPGCGRAPPADVAAPDLVARNQPLGLERKEACPHALVIPDRSTLEELAQLHRCTRAVEPGEHGLLGDRARMRGSGHRRDDACRRRNVTRARAFV